MVTKSRVDVGVDEYYRKEACLYTCRVGSFQSAGYSGNNKHLELPNIYWTSRNLDRSPVLSSCTCLFLFVLAVRMYSAEYFRIKGNAIGWLSTDDIFTKRVEKLTNFYSGWIDINHI